MIKIGLGVFLVTAALLPFHLLYMWRDDARKKRTARLWHKITLWLFGIKVKVTGKPARRDGHGVLLVANHVSWIDIMVLGSVADVSFIAKDEVKGWPLFGWLARLQQSVFVNRDVRSTVKEQASQIQARLAKGDNLVLFAEGTTSCGNFCLPFKSSLFGALGIGAGAGGAGGDNIPDTVQAVAIAYTRHHGIPMSRYDRSIAAWPGDIGIAEHLLGVLREGILDVEVHFGEDVTALPDANRKVLARRMEEDVRDMVSHALRGRELTLNLPEKPLEAAP